MPDIIPFRGLTYNPTKIGDAARVVAPPYDVISPAQQKELYERSPYNVVRIDFSRDADPYARVPRIFAEWQRDGVLMAEPLPAIYYLSQEYALPDGKRKERRGFIALAKIEDFANGKIHGHEATLAEPKEDRLKLMLACDAQFSAIFALYAQEKPTLTEALHGHVQGREPRCRVAYGEYGETRLWAVTEPRIIEMVQKALASEPVFIADGHHRYEAASNYRNLRLREKPGASGNEGFNYVMMFFANLREEGVVILPTHRLVHELPAGTTRDLEKRLESEFDVEGYPKTREGRQEFLRTLRSSDGKQRVVGASFATEPRYLILRLKQESSMQQLAKGMSPALRDLDVSTLHLLLLEHILGISTRNAVNTQTVSYEHDAELALQEVEDGQCKAAFILNPPTGDQMIQVSLAGEKMPQKSTYFFPKLLTGLVINKIEDQPS